MADHSKSERHSKTEPNRPFEIRTCSEFEPLLYINFKGYFTICFNLCLRYKNVKSTENKFGEIMDKQLYQFEIHKK